MSEEPNPPTAGTVPGRDSDTIRRMQADDPEGLRQLLEDHGGTVRMRLRQSFGRLLDNSEIDEVLSLTSIKVWKAARDFDPSLGTLRAWLSVIARNCALRTLAKRGRARRLEQATDVDDMPAMAHESEKPLADRQRLVDDTLACLRQLPPLQRAVLMADFEAGAPARADQLAARLHTSVNSIYVSRHKGRRSLRKLLQKMGHEPTEQGDSNVEGVEQA